MSERARSPGKIILSGEHSVVYGAPAIVVAIARYTTVEFTLLRESNSIKTLIAGLPHIADYPLQHLTKIKNKLDKRFHQFSNGNLPVKNILSRPEDLIIYTLASLAQHLPIPGPRTHLPLPNPGRLQTHSELPLGAGMGSSAAAIAATLVLYESLLNRPLTPEQRFERIRFCERLQHGKGSTIDAAAVTYGGIQKLENQHPSPLNTRLTHWYYTLHGIPIVSTGEVVAHVRQHHAHDTALWQQFSTTTNALEQTLIQQQNPRDAIRENHRLLTHIGVVPTSAQTLIETIEHNGGAAKISGAGAHMGENAGIIIAYTEAPKTLPQSHTWQALTIAPQGAHLL